MSTHFERNPPTLVDYLPRALEYHPLLKALQVRIVLVLARKFNTQEEPEPAIKLAGCPCAAKVRVLAPKQRCLTGYDAEIMVDGQTWDNLPEESRIALLDHELEHLVGVEDNAGKPKMDDRGRPMLRSIPDDWVSSGFFQIIRRHGQFALEAKMITRLNAQVVQALSEAGVTAAEVLAEASDAAA